MRIKVYKDEEEEFIFEDENNSVIEILSKNDQNNEFWKLMKRKDVKKEFIMMNFKEKEYDIDLPWNQKFLDNIILNTTIKIKGMDNSKVLRQKFIIQENKNKRYAKVFTLDKADVVMLSLKLLSKKIENISILVPPMIFFNYCESKSKEKNRNLFFQMGEEYSQCMIICNEVGEYYKKIMKNDRFSENFYKEKIKESLEDIKGKFDQVVLIGKKSWDFEKKFKNLTEKIIKEESI